MEDEASQLPEQPETVRRLTAPIDAAQHSLAHVKSPLETLEKQMAGFQNPLEELQRQVAGFTDPLQGMKTDFARLAGHAESTGIAAETRRWLQKEEELRRLTDPFLSLPRGHLDAFSKPVAETTFLSEINRHLLDDKVQRDWMLATEASVVQRFRDTLDTDFRRVQDFASSARLQESILLAAGALKRFETAFRLPATSEISIWASEARALDAFGAKFLDASGQTTSIAAMSKMHSPWVGIGHEVSSVRAFGDLMALGRGVSERMPFDVGFADGVRSLLGDWRDPITENLGWRDPPTRVALYRDRGVDPALTYFPAAAFDETVELVGLRTETDTAYDPADGTDDGEQRAFRAFQNLRTL
jgi:hypothetical protein